MAEVGILEAKTHFSKLVERAEQGEQIVITRHGKAVARLQPLSVAPTSVDKAGLQADIEKLRALRKGRSLEGTTLRGLIEEGRRSEE